MAKEAYYFSHDSNARNDVKVVKLRRQLGLEGYAIYFILIEILREQEDHKLSLQSIPDLAYEIHTSEEKMKAVVCGFELFQIDENFFFSQRLIRSMDEYKAKINKYIEAGRKGGQASVKQRLNNAQARKERKGKEIKGKEIKINERKVGEGTHPHTFEESKFFNKDVFKEHLSGTQYKDANVEYYHEVIKNWADSKNIKKNNWLATAKNWMASDIKDGKFIANGYKPHNNGSRTKQPTGSEVSTESAFNKIDRMSG